MMNVIIDSRSEPLMQALQFGDSQNTAWTSYDMTGSVPTGDGVWPAGHGGQLAPQRLFILPYCEGQAGSNFSVRVYGWRGIEQPDGGANRNVWIPFLLAELACVSCNRFGPANTGPTPPQPYAGRFIQADEALCDTITLTQGSVGPTGEVVSTGPGSDLIAFAIVELRGARFFQFDFQQTDPVPMNALWARA